MGYDTNDYRNQVQAIRKQTKGSETCFDCNAPNPIWGSVNLGIYLCYNCAARHRSYGPHISFVRSLTLDKWTKEQAEGMLRGGNSAFRRFLEHCKINSHQIDYQEFGTTDAYEHWRSYVAGEIAENELYGDLLAPEKNISKNDKIPVTREVVTPIATQEQREAPKTQQQPKRLTHEAKESWAVQETRHQSTGFGRVTRL